MIRNIIILAGFLTIAMQAVAEEPQPSPKRLAGPETPYLAPIESALFAKAEYFTQLREKLMTQDIAAFGITSTLPRSKLSRLWFRCICTSSNDPEWQIGVLDTGKTYVFYSGFGSKMLSETGKILDVSVERHSVEISGTLRDALVKALEFVVSETRAQTGPKWTATFQAYFFNVNGAEGRVLNPQPESRPGKLAALACALRDCALQGTPVTQDQEQSMLQICRSVEE